MNAGKLIYLLALIEGGNLLAFEVVCSRLYTPYIGSGVSVWTAILAITLFALALGYRMGAKVETSKMAFRLILSFSISGLLILLSPFFASFVLPLTYGMEIQSSAIIGGLAILFVPVFFMGQISPLLSQLKAIEEQAKTSGIIYGIGTLAGVVLTLLSVFLLVPSIGVRANIFLLGGIQLSGAVISYFLKAKNE